MGRKSTNPVYQYYEKDTTKAHVYLCQCKTNEDVKQLRIARSSRRCGGESDNDEESVDTPQALMSDDFVKIKCLKAISGKWGPSNLEHHLEAKHPDKFTELRVKKNSRGSNSLKSNNSDQHSFDSSESDPVPVKKKKLIQSTLPSSAARVLQLRVLVSLRYIEESCIMLVTEDGRPFKAVEDKAWRKILNPYLTALKNNNIKLVINRRKVASWVRDRAMNVRKFISKQLQGKIIHLKIDGATKFNRSFLGVNAQYLNENREIEVVTLGMIELVKRHTGDEHRQAIQELLKIYDISLDQIYAIVSDNGANMLCVGKLLNKVQNGQLPSSSNVSNPNTNANDSDSAEEEEISDTYADEWDDFSVEEQVIDADIYDQTKILQDLLESEKFSAELESFWNCIDYIVSIRCAAHSLQLAIHDMWKSKPEVEGILDKVREIVKKLRTTNGSILLKKYTSLNSLLDNDTRWGSTYRMLERLLTMKSCIQELAKEDDVLHLTVQEWSEIQSIKDSLEPSKIATVKLQYEQCTLRDLCIIFSKCIADTKKINHSIAQSLVKYLRDRRDKLFLNITFLTSLYLDPCFKSLLSKEQKEIVTKHILKLYERILMMKKKDRDAYAGENCSRTPNPTQSTETEKKSSNEAEAEMSVIDDELFSRMSNGTEEQRVLSTGDSAKLLLDLKEDIREYETGVLPEKSEVEELLKRRTFDFWNKHRSTYPRLFEVACVIHSVPCTQTSVERLFSSLDFIMPKRRYNLLSQSVNDILTIRDNAHIVKKAI